MHGIREEVGLGDCMNKDTVLHLSHPTACSLVIRKYDSNTKLKIIHIFLNADSISSSTMIHAIISNNANIIKYVCKYIFWQYHYVVHDLADKARKFLLEAVKL